MARLTYFTDDELVCQLRMQFPREKQYKIDFRKWLNTMRLTDAGYVIQVENRKFLVDTKLGVVIREL